MFSDTFITLGKILSAACGSANNVELGFNDEINSLRQLAYECCNFNGWFSPQFVNMQLGSIAKMLDANAIKAFEEKYELGNIGLTDKKVKVIAAGNIPLVCFHDMFCVLSAGFKLVIKYSSKDNVLPRAVVGILQRINPLLKDRIIEETAQNIPFDAIIATGSNNSARYFDYYFSKYPNIIRCNRNSVAVLSGNESADDYRLLADDIFAYYGLGCRSVSKIYVPQGFNYDTFFGNILFMSDIAANAKYSDNYTYNKAIYLMSGAKFLDNGFIILKNDEGFSSPVGVLYCQEYLNIDSLSTHLRQNRDKLQCVVSNIAIEDITTVPFGCAQHPRIDDFADGVDTVEFLKSISR